MTSAPNLQALAQLSAERALNSMAEGMGIALFAWILLRAVGRQNSGTRFAVWFSALWVIAALPLFDSSGSTGAGLASRSEIKMPACWALYLFGTWVVIAAVGLIRVGVGLWQLRRLRRSCIPINVTDVDPALRKTLEDFKSSRAVAICVSDHLRVPTAIGFTKPLVVIPAWAIRELSATELNAILLHELAHLQRWDDWTNLAQKILGALLFFHPAVWWIAKKLSLEREMACDDLVLAQTTNPRAYAQCLVSLAERNFLRRSLALAQAVVNHLRQTSLRVSQILDVNRPSATRVWKPALGLLTAFSLASLLALPHTPPLLAFENSSATLATSPSARNAIASSGIDSSQIPSAGSRVIPRVETRQASAPVFATMTRPDRKATIIPARAVQRRVKSPMLIGASTKRASPEENAAVPQTLFVVMQARQYDASGSVVWSLCLWRVTVASPMQNRMEKGIVAKSI